MAEQTVELAPGESTTIAFEATPHEARTYQVSVDGLTGSFIASEAPPELANIYGVVTFRKTGAPLGEVKISLNGVTTYTNASGEYLIENVAPGDYLMTLEKEGYDPLSDTVSIVAGDNKIDAEMTLVPALMASLRGYVTDAATGAAISGAEITIVELTDLMEANVYKTTSDTNGFYSLENMAFENSPIVVDISVKAIRYEMLIMEEVPLAEGGNELSVQMIPKEIPGEPALVSFDYPEQVESGTEFWAGQTVFLPYTPGVMYDLDLLARGDSWELWLFMEKTAYLAADIYDELEAKGLSPGEKYIRFSESGEYTHYGVGLESYSEPAKASYIHYGYYETSEVPFPAGIYPVRSLASVYHVEVGYHLDKPYTKRTKISDLWDTVVGNIGILLPISGWVSPIGHNDPYNAWTRAERAYDRSVDTYAYSKTALDLNEWSKPLELTFVSPILSDKARFNADWNSVINDEIDLDVHRDGVWVDVYQGPFEDHIWVEKAFPQGSVDKARIRMRHTTGPAKAAEWLYEFQLWSF